MDGASPSRPEVTQMLARGVCRMLIAYDYAPVLEVPLANGRRADIAAIGPKGDILIVETKSCFEDYRVDGKWQEYAPYCDTFYFAVSEDFPQEVLPDDVGLIVADGFGGAYIRPPAAQVPLTGARRKMMTLLIARIAAKRLAIGE